jgi:hypothetical protein
VRESSWTITFAFVLAACAKNPGPPASESFAKDAPLAQVDRALPRVDRPPIAVVLTRDRIDVSVAVWAEHVMAAKPDREYGDVDEFEKWRAELLKEPTQVTGLDPNDVEGHLIDPLYDLLSAEADRQKGWAEARQEDWPATVELFIAPDVPMGKVVDVLYTIGRAEWHGFIFVVRTTGGLGYLQVIPPKFGGTRGRTPDADECVSGIFTLSDPGIGYGGRIRKGQAGVAGRRSFNMLGTGREGPLYDDCFFLPARDGAAPLAEFTDRMTREAWERPLCRGSAMRFGDNRPWHEAATLFGVVQGHLGDLNAVIEAGSGTEGYDPAIQCEAPPESPLAKPSTRVDVLVRAKEITTDAEHVHPVQRTVERRVKALEPCYERLLDDNPTATFALKYSIKVNTSGRVEEVEVETEVASAADLKSCTAAKVKGWRFPSQLSTDEFSIAFTVAFDRP